MQNGTLAAELKLVRNGLVFESIVVIILIIMLVGIYIHYRHRPSQLTKLLLFIFIAYTFGIFFSWLAKFLYWTGGFTSIDAISEDTQGFYFYKLIFKYRLSFTFILIGAYLNYIFKARVFEKEMKRGEKIIITTYCIGSLIFNIAVIPTGDSTMDLISFALLFLLMVLVYIPFIISTFRLAKRIDEKIYRKGLQSLGIMGICLIMVTVCMLLDRAMIIFFDSAGYTFFYYLGWMSTILGVLFAYYGYCGFM